VPARGRCGPAQPPRHRPWCENANRESCSRHSRRLVPFRHPYLFGIVAGIQRLRK
jgi:hypothetical protein